MSYKKQYKINALLLRISRHLILNSSYLNNLGLYHGKMGIVLFFVHYARYTQKTIYNNFAEELLDEIYKEIHLGTPTNFENGLCGIGWGIEYLLENGFMNGDSDEILNDIDKKIMELEIKWISDKSVKKGLGGIIYYVSKRLRSKSRFLGKMPFNEEYICSISHVIDSFQVVEDREILSSIYQTSPITENFYNSSLGLFEGCAGMGINTILR